MEFKGDSLLFHDVDGALACQYYRKRTVSNQALSLGTLSKVLS